MNDDFINFMVNEFMDFLKDNKQQLNEKTTTKK